ncbi:MAG: hypothetical protein JNJ58_07060 [Chitinophagaceae bacterium]|nr:hypothetical protein [Chitinophagaceae bacterium]
MRKFKNVFLLAFCISCGLLMLFFLGYTNLAGQGFLVEDSHSYLNLLNTFTPDAYRTIGYPLFLTFIHTIPVPGDFMNIVFMIQWILWIVSVWLCGRMMMQWIPWPYVWMICGLLLLNPSFTVYSHLILTEICFIFLIVLSVHFLFLFQTSQNKINALLAFGLLCIATLFRPGLFYFEIFIGIILMLYLIRKRDWKSGILFLTIFSVFIILPIRQYHQQYHVYKLSIIDDLTIYRYLNAQALCLTENGDLQTTMKKLDDASLSIAQASVEARSAFYRKAFRQTLSAHPAAVIKAFGMNLISNIHTGNTYYPQTCSRSNQIWVFHISRMLNMLYCILLLCAMVIFPTIYLRRKRWISLWQNAAGILVMLYCFYQFFSSGVSFWQGDRFNIVWMPLLSIGIISLWTYRRMKKA